MPNFFSLSSALVLATLLFSCGSGGSAESSAKSAAPLPPAPYIVGNLRIDHDVPEAERRALVEAYANLDSEPMKQAEPELLSLLNTTDASSRTIKNWIEERVQYILPENMDVKNRLYEAQKNWVYENPGQLPPEIDNLKQITTQTSEVNGITIMTNIGSLYYLLAKKLSDTLLGFKVNGFGIVNLSSPRVGLLKIGKGFSLVSSSQSKYQEIAAPFRVSTLIHESRHSDGSGKYTGFLHAKCPSGHDYSGIAACDAVANGAYKIGSLVIKSYLRSCNNCSYTQKEMLKTLYLDTAGRVLPNSPTVDDRPEGHR